MIDTLTCQRCAEGRLQSYGQSQLVSHGKLMKTRGTKTLHFSSAFRRFLNIIIHLAKILQSYIL